MKHIISKLTVEEKAALVAGTQFWETNPIPRLNIPSMYMTDGPCGLRKQGENGDHLGINGSEQTTSFPTSATQASSWNPENIRKMGKALAEECKHFGVNMILGPGVNIKRNPTCGRNFEYFSEDPLVSGVMGQAFVESVQEHGVGTSLKHFAVNNNENYRFMGDSIVDERALREIYLRAFEKIVKNAQPTTVMSAYNKVNGTYCANNKYLLTDILRKEWGFKGAVISDWGGVDNRVASIEAGLDLEMPGDCEYFRKQLLEAVYSGQLDEKDLDSCVERVLNLLERTQIEKRNTEFDVLQHHQTSIDIAVDSAVLMKNNGLLPLDSKEKYLIIGDLFEKMRFQGAGSSLINPTMKVTPLEAFQNRNIAFEYLQGYDQNEQLEEKRLLADVLEAIENYDKVLLFIGQTDFTESEGYDREKMQLPDNQLRLLQVLLESGKKIGTVLYGGSPVEMDLVNQTDAILNMYLPGQGGGEATARLLFGEDTPSGKLAETWMSSYEAVPFGNEFVQQKEELYKESIYVGYRYYDALPDSQVAYPFGHGLSYTTFHLTPVEVDVSEENVHVSLTVTNTGSYAGAEVVQVYVSNPKTDVFKPVKELRAFQKVYLEKGESKHVRLDISIADLAYYNPIVKDWIVENGDYTIHLATSSRHIHSSKGIQLAGFAEVESPYPKGTLPSYEDVRQLSTVTLSEFEQLLGRKLSIAKVKNKKESFTLNTPIRELQTSLFGRLFYKGVVGIGEKQYQKALKMPEGAERDMNLKNGKFIANMMPNNSLRSMSVSSAGQFPYTLAQGMLELVKGHPIRAIKQMRTKVSVPPLPKDCNEHL